MGNFIGYRHFKGRLVDPDITPEPDVEPSFDSSYGFAGNRKEKVLHATRDQLLAAKVNQKDWDYCVDVFLKFKACKVANSPMFTNCLHEKHDLEHCQYREMANRMKEYEREWRLKKRKDRIERQKARELELAMVE